MPGNKVGVDDGSVSEGKSGIDNPAASAGDGEQGLPGPTVSYTVSDETVRAEKPGLEPAVVGYEGEAGGKSPDDPEQGSEAELRDKPYAGMGKEDLLRFSDTAFWNRFRLISILIFWAAWLALLGAVIGLTIVAPRCGDRPTPAWWQKSLIYQIYVRSFYDSDGDGVGDIKGVIEKLDYLKELNVDVILLSSIYESYNGMTGSSQPDYGYEVIDHKNIRADYGNLNDVQQLIDAAHNRSMWVIFDFIPNHTGLEHPWFLTQRDESYSNPYWNYYTVADCPTAPDLPNNWKTVYGEDAWTELQGRLTRQCFLHQFLNTQPELNLRSSGVQAELESILRFWLDMGVDGFRVVNSDFLMESVDLQYEPVYSNYSGCALPDCNPYDCMNHTLTRSQPEGFDLIARWREIVNEYSTGDLDKERMLITDADVSVGNGMRYYGRSGEGANLALNRKLSRVPTNCNGKCMNDIVQSFTQSIPTGATPTWLVSDQDSSRLPSKFDPIYHYAVNMLLLTLPGTSLVYYGDELGMVDFDQTNPPRDPVAAINPSLSRDPYRTPMQWNNQSNAGFSNASETWLSVNTNYLDINAAKQLSQENSTVNLFKSLAGLRRDEASYQYGAIHYLTGFNENLIAYVREHEGFDRFLTVINFGTTTVSGEDVTRDRSSIKLPNKAEVVLSTHSGMTPVGDEIDLRKIGLEPGQGHIAKWEYERPN